MARSSKKSRSKHSKPTNNYLKWIGVALLAMIVLAALTFYFSPSIFKKVQRDVIIHLNPDPQTSDVILPNEGLLGIDISHYQKEIAWEQLTFMMDNQRRLTKQNAFQSRRVDFVVAKVTEGVTQKDNTYQRNKSEAEKHGITFGGYHFFSVTSDPVQQAIYFIQESNLTSGNMVPVLDVEYQGKLSTTELRKRVLLWLQTVEKHYGKKPILYTSLTFQKEVFQTKEFSSYPIWLARYGARPTSKHVFWQFTESAVVSGIKGYVDVDLFDGTYKEFVQYILP